ncbi:MAG: family 31 glucosidase, partial [Bifidobacteriaceae bacterium]|nr:family 31 glucosidase [Bifidobacteriaceae bacterium]
QVKANYYDQGARVWWLDACEPELNPTHPGNLSLYAGPGAQVGSAYPRDHARGFAEGLAAIGAEPTVLLCRSAWAGQAKYGAAVWSGDIAPTWQSMAEQVRAGLSIGLAGIPWWTTDIGGFHGGDPADPAYRELFVRWFQYATYCPLMRLHGHREPRSGIASGGPNEPWSYGEDVYGIVADHIRRRQRLRPYLAGLMAQTAASGVPPMRPLFVDVPDDPTAWNVEDQFMLGPDRVVAPVTVPGASERDVYLPRGEWTEESTGQPMSPGWHTVPTPLTSTPTFIRQPNNRAKEHEKQ